MVELVVLAGLAFAALIVVGALLSVFSVVGWFLWLPFKILGWAFRLVGLLVVLPFVLIACFLGGFGVLLSAGVLLIPLLPVFAICGGLWWLLRPRRPALSTPPPPSRPLCTNLLCPLPSLSFQSLTTIKFSKPLVLITMQIAGGVGVSPEAVGVKVILEVTKPALPGGFVSSSSTANCELSTSLGFPGRFGGRACGFAHGAKGGLHPVPGARKVFGVLVQVHEDALDVERGATPLAKRGG